MISRTVMIFPRFENVDVIDAIRAKYDPLAALVRPHITLVFPFQSNLPTDGINNCLTDALTDKGPFKLALSGVSAQSDAYGHYLFLDVREGRKRLRELNRALYGGILAEYRTRRPYTPHMTIGKLPAKEALAAAYEDTRGLEETFRTIVDTVSVEVIGPNEESVIEMEYGLG